MSERIDISRYRSVVAVGLSIFLVVVLVNFVILGTLGSSPKHICAKQLPLGWEHIEYVNGAVSRLSELEESGYFDDDKPLVLLLGLSSAGAAINPTVLANEDGIQCRYVFLGISGLSIDNILSAYRTLLHSGLRPSVVVLCLNPWMMVGDPRQPAGTANPFPDLFAGEWKQAERATRKWSWITHNSRDINHQVRELLHRGRMSVFDACDLDYSAFTKHRNIPITGPGGSEKYASIPILKEFKISPERYKRMDNKGPTHEQWMIDVFGKRGWFDEQMYRECYSDSSSALAGLVTGIRELGSKVIVVLMPEESAFLDRVPKIGGEMIEKSLDENFGANAPALWDMRRAIPADYRFKDYVHLDRYGQTIFSWMLAKKIGNFISDTTDKSSPSSQDTD